MPKYFLFAAIALIIFTVPCCFPPEPVIRLSLEDENKVFIMGSEYTKVEANGIEAIAAFIEGYNDMLIFDISIANYTDSVVRVEPEKFYFLEEGKSEYAIRKIPTLAYDPELKSLEYEKKENKEDARYASQKLSSISLAILDFAADVSTIGKTKTQEEIEDEAAEDENMIAESENADLHHEEAIDILNGELKRWSIYSLRKTDLPPGYAVRGMVYFPARIYAKRIILYLPIGDRTIKLIYNQQKF